MKEAEKETGEFLVFTLVSALISFGYNVVMTVIPLRMADRGLGYGEIGGVMSAVAVGLMVIKLAVGHLSDLFGTKRIILTSLLGLSAVCALLAQADSLAAFAVLMAALGIFRGIFLSVNGSSMLELSGNGRYGKVLGVVQGVSSLLASVGGMMAGLLYSLREGEYALLLCSLMLLASALWAALGLKRVGKMERERMKLWKVFGSMNRRLVLFCLIVFIQSFAAGPMWNFIIPMYCYQVLLFSPALLGILMSLDELVSAPAYMLAGAVVDRVNVFRFNVVFLLLTAAGGILLTRTGSTAAFMLVFLFCSVCTACTFVGIPKERIDYIRRERKGLELALLSVCGSLGDSLGSNVMGQAAERFSIDQCMLIFASAYVLMAALAALPALLFGKKCSHTR